MTKKLTFEESVERLEEIVRELEGEGTDLDTSLKLYEEGIALLRSCSARLDAAEQKVKMLQVGADGNAVLADFGKEENA